MVQNPRLWIAVADGEHARFVERGADNGLHTRVALDSADAHKQTSDLVADRAGRAFESGSPTRHAVAPRHDPHEQAQLHFAHTVAAQLSAADRDGAFDQLVLVAPPDVLHAVQAKLDQGAAKRVVGTLMKDLVKTPDHALQPHLATWVEPVVRR